MADPVVNGLGRGFAHMVRKGLRGVWTRGEPPAAPFVWAANHHSWWDPFLAAVLLNRRGVPASLVMDQENLSRYGFARRLGVFGTREPRRGLDFLRAGRALVIFPEGALRPAGPLGTVAAGAGWYAGRAGVPLCAVAVRLALRGHQAPEAYLAFEEVAPDRLATVLADLLSTVDGLIARTDPRAELPGFTPVIRGQRSWDERIDRLARRLPWVG